MSTTIDQRVVEMRFDNQQFEKNVSTTMSSLDKLKQSLNFTGASKGLNTLSTAAGNVNMSSLANSVETVRTRFSALEVMGVTALANITNSAVNAGKRMISALTIDPVKTGLQEYETQMNAVQTILANTQSKGTTIDDVNVALDELNKYADQTIYNFTEMTRNIGTFTAAGVGLKESVSAIKGIANLAAVSGSTSQQASTAMYQLSQAIATGTVRLQDWNSVVNAGMGGEVFQNALVRTAATMAGASENVEAWRKKNIDSYGSFRDSLTKGEWLTTEVLTKTLEQFTMYAQEGTKEWEAYKKSLLDQGYTEKQADEILKMANTATEAATKVKTFTQLWDVLKESAQSGWSQTWKLIIGDFEEAKSLLSPLAETLTGFIGKMSDARNNLLEGVLNFSAPWQRIMDKLEDSGLGTVKKVAETVSNMTHGLEYFQDVVNKVWRGDYMNSDTGRFEMLEAAGYDHRVVQDLVNKGLDYKLTMEDVEASHKKFGLTMSETTTEVTDLTSAIDFLTDKQLEEAGLTENEIRLYRDLAEESKRTGKSISELAEEMSKTDGRQVLVSSFKNVGDTLIAIFRTVKDAWSDVFEPVSIVKLYNALKGVEEFSEGIRKWGENTDNLDKLTRSFAGLFAVIDIITTVVGGGFKLAFNILTQVLSYFNMDLLDLTARIGDILVKFSDWIDAGLDITGILDVIVPLITSAADATKEWFGSLKELDYFKKYIDSLEDAREAIKNWISGLKEADNIPQYILEGLANGLKNGVKIVVDTIMFIGRTIIEAICGVLGIESPSTVFFAIGGFIIAGLVAGLLSGGPNVKETITSIGSDISKWFNELDLASVAKTIGTKFSQLFSEIDLGKILAVGLGVGMLSIANKFANILEVFAAPLEGLGALFEGLGDMFDGIGASFKAKAWEHKSKALLNFAFAVIVMVGALYVLTKLDSDRLWESVGALSVLAVVVAGLATVSTLLNKIGPMGGQSLSILALSTSVLIIAYALEKVASINSGDMERALTTIIVLGGVVAALATVSTILNKFGAKLGGGAIRFGTTILGISAALLIMAGTIKAISLLSQNDIEKGLIVIGALGLLIVALINVSKLAGENASKAGSMLFKISIALLIMVGVIALAANLSENEVRKGLAVIATVELLFAAIIAVSKLAGKNASKAGTMLLMMSGALAIVVYVLKQLSGISDEEVKRGLTVISVIELLFAGIIAVSKLAGQNAMKAGVMLLSMSVAMGILVGLLFIVSKMEPDGVYRALGIISVLGTLFAGLIAVTKLAENSKGTIIALTVAIAVLSAALIALSIIDPSGLNNATKAISAVLISFGLLIAATSKLNGMKAPIGTLVMLTIVVAAIAAIIGTMASLGVEGAIKTAGSISILLGTMSVAMLILSKTKGSLVGAVGNLILMGVVVAELASILGVMSYLNVEGSIATASSLSVLLIAMSSAMLILGLVKSPVVGAVGCLMLMGIVVAELAAILGVMSYMNVEASIPTALALSVLLVGMSAALAILAPVGPLAGPALAAVGVLMVFIIAVGALLVGIGALATYWTDMETFIDKGIPILEKIGYGLGSFVGNLVGGLASGVAMSSLASIGLALSDFMDNVKPFIEGAKDIDEDVVDGVSSLAKAFLILSGASFVDGLSKLFGSESSLSSFSSKLPELGTHFKAFSDELGEFTPAQVETVTCVSEAILALANAAKQIPNDGGLWGSICGENSLSVFSDRLPGLACDIRDFITNLGGFTPEQVKTAGYAAEVIKTLANAAKQIPNDGGLWGSICGENSLSVFGFRLPGLANSIKDFITNLGDLSSDQVETANAAGQIITTLAEAAEAIPNDGGLWGAIFGENSISVFGTRLPYLGEHLAKFVEKVKDLTPDQVQTAKTAGDIIITLAEAAEKLPNDGGLWGKIVGDNSLTDFATSLGTLGGSVKELINNIGTITPEQTASLQNGLNAITTISTICERGMDVGNIKDFGKNVSKLAEELKDFADDMLEITASNITGAVNKVKTVVDAIKGITNADVSTVKSFGDALSKLGKDGVSKFVESITSSSSTADVKGAASKMLKTFTDEVEDGQSDAETAFNKVVKAGADKMKSETNRLKFKNAAAYLVEGFAKGIKDNKSKATAEAQAMVDAVEAIVREGLAINSPSKVFIDIGSSIPEGFAMGIEKMSRVVSMSSDGLGNVAIAGVRDSLSRISDAINSDVDTQPTIRPVIDMTDVETKVGTINRMFNTNASVGVMANVSSISSSMNARQARKLQAESNHELIAAIKGLHDSPAGDTYIIEGITYDDGSAISDAMKTIVRKATMERRV